MDIFVVGGAVRDTLLGLEPKDLDFVVVGSTPEEMFAKGFTQVGADFPVFLDAEGREFALARTERKSGSGHRGFVTDFDPEVTLKEDLVRRDLTINALAVLLEDWEAFVKGAAPIFVIDYVDGVQDLKNRELRHVSEAFREDPLRVLRVARFAARFDFKIVDETIALMREIVRSGELNDLTSERVWKEMSRAMMEEFPHQFFTVLFKVNALQAVVSYADLAFCDLRNRLTKLVSENASEVQRWMSVFFDMDVASMEYFIEKHVLPTDIVKAIRFGLAMMGAFFHGSYQVMEVCKQFRVWSSDALLEELADMIHILEPHLTNRFDSMVDAIQRASAIGFISLSSEDQKVLTGEEIGKAIDAQRMEIITEWEHNTMLDNEFLFKVE